MALLEIDDLRVRFRTRDGIVKAVDGVSLGIERGRTLGIVGESGSGKSVTALTLMGLTRLPNATVEGRVLLDGVDLLELPAGELRRIRGKRISMIFQDPLSSLHPLYRVGDQIVEAIRAHEKAPERSARRRALEALARGRHPETGGAPRELPARALGRHAPARHDRDGARPRSRGPDRRRADDRARRHRPGPDPRPDRRAPAGAWHRGRPHHPRPRRRGGDGRRGGRHVRGPRRRARVAPRGARRPAAPLHVGPAAVAARRAAERAAASDPGLAAEPDRCPERLRLPSPLHVRVRVVCSRSCPGCSSQSRVTRTPASFRPRRSARSGRGLRARRSAA